MQNSLKIRIKNQSTNFNWIERAEPFLPYRVAGGQKKPLKNNKSGNSEQ